MLQKPLGVENIDPVYWTLWVELCFYLMFAVVVWRGVTYRRVVLFCGLWTVGSVVAYGIQNDTLTMLVNPVYSPFFIAGMAYYLMYRFRPTPLLWGIVGMSWVLSAHYALTKTSGAIPWSQWEPRRARILILLTGIYAVVAIGPSGTIAVEPGLRRPARLDQSRFVGEDDCLGAVSDAEFGEQAGGVVFHGLDADAHRLGDFGVVQARRDQA